VGYKILGYIVWQGGKWYLKRRLPDRRVVAAGVVGAGIAVILVRNAARSSG
jgi:hypothetical protein